MDCLLPVKSSRWSKLADSRFLISFVKIKHSFRFRSVRDSPKYILIVFTIMIDIKTPANYTSNPTILLRESFLIYLPSYRWKRSATIQTLNKFEFNVNRFEISLHAGGDVRGLFKMPQMRKEYKINFHHPTYKGLLFKFKFAQYSNLPFALSCTICPLMR